MNTKKDVSGMPSTSRPRGLSGTGSGGSGRPAVSAPMSERQQMALLMQMTSSSNEAELSPGGNHPRSRERTNERGETTLHLAAKKGDHDSVKKLLEQGNNPNVTDFAGWTPLHEACNHGHYNVALALVKSGANVNATGLDDDTPLHDAAIVGQLKLVKMLVERGADPTFKNQKGKMPCDVAAPAVYNYLLQARDAVTSRTSQQIKKPPDATKKANNEGEAEENAAGNTNANAALSNKDEDDIYEFKSTPKDSCSSSDEKSDAGSSKNDKSSDDKSATDNDNNQSSTVGVGGGGGGNTVGNTSNQVPKRPFSEIAEGVEENTNSNDDDVKRKKRKDSDAASKDGSKGNTAGNRTSTPRLEKGAKTAGPVSKNLNLATKNILDRKSPCASPKPAAPNLPSSKTTDSDAEAEDGSTKNSDSNFNAGGGGGPKVPPLKIVIPQQNTSGDTETGGNSRNGKNASARSHAALPYVVASSNSNDSSADKESVSSRSASPLDSKSCDEKTAKSNDERTQQRVLRSSHRSGAGQGGSSVDRGSNNSSPQMQQNSSSPSPASTSGESSQNNAQPNQNASNGSPGNANANNNINNNEAEPSSSSNPTPSVPSSTPTNVTASTSSATQQTPSTSTSNSTSTITEAPVHPRKRKIKTSKDQSSTQASTSSASATTSTAAPSATEDKKDIKEECSDVHPHDQPITNCYQMYLNIRKQIERRQKNLLPVQPKPPQGFKDYLLNRCTYVLANKTPAEPVMQIPQNLAVPMKEMFTQQEKERYKLKMQHIVEKEKLVLAVEQEILRVHGRAARALANQSLPFSVCTILKDEEVYNIITPEQEEKDRNARSRYNGRLFLSWLQDVDDKWEKIKEAMLLRHHNEAESLHAVQKMDYEWKMKELSLCEFKAKPIIEDAHVPMVHVSDDFDLLPA